MISCPYCGNTTLVMSYVDNTYYCFNCGFYFSKDPLSGKAGTLNLSNTSTADIESNIRIHLPIDKDNIDKFNVIEINGIKFVREK